MKVTLGPRNKWLLSRTAVIGCREISLPVKASAPHFPNTWRIIGRNGRPTLDKYRFTSRLSPTRTIFKSNREDLP